MSVYFLRSADLIKIGYSSHLIQRVQSIISTVPTEVHFLGHMPGDRNVEAHLHDRFAAHRFSGEWFATCPDLEALIKIIANPTLPDDGLPKRPQRHAKDEDWRAMSERVRAAAARMWPDLQHQHRKVELAKRLGWKARRARALYDAQPGMTLRQIEADELERLLFSQVPRRGSDEPSTTLTNGEA